MKVGWHGRGVGHGLTVLGYGNEKERKEGWHGRAVKHGVAVLGYGSGKKGK